MLPKRKENKLTLIYINHNKEMQIEFHRTC